MTNKEKNIFKKAAQEAMEQNGVKVFRKYITLLETGNTMENIFGHDVIIPTYIMFEDRKTGKQYQCYYGVSNYTSNHKSLWAVDEYVD